MASLKNITDLPVAESADGLNLIVNDNGAAKQIAASVIEGKVKTINGVEPDESGDVQIDTASSWNDLKDKPFYEEGPSEHIYAEAVLPESHMSLPEATYELGKTYIVEVNGVREEYEFVSAYIQAIGVYRVGFNIKDGNQGVMPADVTRPLYMLSMKSFTKEKLPDGAITCELEFRSIEEDAFVYPVNVKVLYIEHTIHQIDPKYIKDMYYSIPGVYTPAVITKPNEFSDRIYIDYPLERYKPYVVRVDGAVYSFDELKKGDYSPASGYYPWYLGAKFVLNTSAIQWDYPFTIFSMGNSGPKEPTEIRFEDGTTNHTVEFLGKETVHKLDGKYLPDPFWVEEKKILVVEGVSDGGRYRVETQPEDGKEYTYLIDGIECSGTAYLDDTDNQVWLFLHNSSGEGIASAYSTWFNLYDSYFDITKPHKIELVEKIYHTHHDFMIISKSNNDDIGEDSIKVVAGDFATAKEKILKGLPATAYVSHTIYGDGWYEVGSYIDDVSYHHRDDGFEACILPAFGIGILPDNTID